jgi:hypothetical protein
MHKEDPEADPLRIETADDAEAVAESLSLLASALAQDRGVAPPRPAGAAKKKKAEDRSRVADD